MNNYILECDCCEAVGRLLLRKNQVVINERRKQDKI